MIRLCVISDKAGPLLEWLDAVDPLRFHFTVESAASTGMEAVSASRKSTIHVWVCRVDQATHISDALEAAGVADSRFVVIASDLEEVSSAADKGFRRVVLNEGSLWVVAAAFQAARNGQSFLSPAITDAYQEGIAELIRSPETDQIRCLTSREIEVVLQLMEGRSNDEISRKVFASRATVSTHLLSVYRKLGCSNRTEVAIFAFKNAAVLRDALDKASTNGTHPLSDAGIGDSTLSPLPTLTSVLER